MSMGTVGAVLQKRNNSIELLRCVLMFLIVLHHICLFYAHGGFGVRACSAMTAFSTDAFAFITGFYGTRFKWSKVLQLIGFGLFASVAIWGVGNYLLDSGVAYRFSMGWFGNSYLAMLLVVPIVNAAVETLSRKPRVFRMAYGCYCTAMLISWLPIMRSFDVSVAGWYGHSFNTLLFLYVTGRYLKVCDLAKIGSKILVGCFLLCLICHVSFVGGINYVLPSRWMPVLNQLRDFNAPWLLVAAMLIVILLSRVKLPKILDWIAGFLAPSMFSVYLLHEGCNPLVSRACYVKYGVGQGGAVALLRQGWFLHGAC